MYIYIYIYVGFASWELGVETLSVKVGKCHAGRLLLLVPVRSPSPAPNPHT